MKKIRPSYIPAIVWFIVVTVLLTLPGSSFPKENWLDKIWFDKWIHIGLFAILAMLWCWAMLRKYAAGINLKKTFLQVGLLCIIYGAGMEFVQKYFIPGRSFDLGDIAADAAGCTLGVIYSIRRYIKK